MQSGFSNKLNHKPRRTSLQSLLIYPFVILIVMAVISTSLLSLYNSGKAVNAMAWQLTDEIAARIEGRVLMFLDRAHLVNEINANAIEAGQLNLKSIREQEIHFWHQVKSFDYISYSYIGRADGGFFGARRLADGTLQTIATSTLTGGKIQFFNTDHRGRLVAISSTLPYYDHKTRPWYKAGIEAGKPTWSPVFIDAGGEGLTITAAAPLYDEQKKLLGVLGCSFIFSHINQFLHSLKIGESGQAFIIERTGLLVATSTLDETYTTDKKRIPFLESKNPLVNQTGKSISLQVGDLSKISKKQQLSVFIQGERHFVHLSPLTDRRGIEWLTVVVVPEKDFMSHVKAGNFNTGLLTLLALGITIAVGFMISRRITRPILELNIATKSLAAGQWSRELQIDRQDEVGELAGSFNLMVRNLQATTVSRDRLAEEVEERKKIEAELQKLAAVVERSSEIVNLAALDGKMIFLNEAGRAMLGISAHEVGNHSIMDVISDELKPRVENEVLPAMMKEGRWKGDLRYRNLLTGALFDVHAMTFTIYDADGKPLYLANVSLDITDRKRAEEALRAQESKLSSIFRATPVGIGMVVNRVFREANETLCQMTGYPLAEILGKNARILYPTQEDYDYVGREKYRQIGEKSTGTVETRWQRKDGTIIDIILSSTPLDPEDLAKGVTFTALDITDRKKAEEEKRVLEERLQRAEKMEALGTLAGGVAHDLNNVLGVVVGYAELLLKSVDQTSPIRPRLVNIMKGGERAAAIVQDLLTLARRGVPIRQVLNLNDLIMDGQQSPEFANLSHDYPTMKLKLDLAPDLLNITGSPVHLSKTLYNLVSNAGEAMVAGGTLTVKTANQYLDKPIHGYDEIREGDYVVLSVSDTGEGIAPADMKRIFEPFYTKKVMGRSGTGLGLAVVWGTVKDHQGYIDVKSEERKGSIFTLYFPVTRAMISGENVAVAISEYMGKGESILVVDDVEGQRNLAADMLRELKYQAVCVASGEEAVAYLQEHEVDLMILDMIMEPGMDGLETYRSVLTIHPQQKAVIVSGFSETYRVNAAQALGAGTYVKKPFTIEKLGLAVRKELDRK